jgi:hypothetical protein
MQTRGLYVRLRFVRDSSCGSVSCISRAPCLRSSRPQYQYFTLRRFAWIRVEGGQVHNAQCTKGCHPARRPGTTIKTPSCQESSDAPTVNSFTGNDRLSLSRCFATAGELEIHGRREGQNHGNDDPSYYRNGKWLSICEPAPNAKASGSIPATVASAVMTIGRKRQYARLQ